MVISPGPTLGGTPTATSALPPEITSARLESTRIARFGELAASTGAGHADAAQIRLIASVPKRNLVPLSPSTSATAEGSYERRRVRQFEPHSPSRLILIGLRDA